MTYIVNDYNFKILFGTIIHSRIFFFVNEKYVAHIFLILNI